MDESGRKVLEMLAVGKLSVEEAEALLSKLDGEGKNENGDDPLRGKNPRYLKIVVDSKEGDKVNLKIPLGLIKAGIKLSALMPGDAAKQISAHGLDLSNLAKLNGGELIDALKDLQIDVESAEGDNVRIFTE